MEIILQLNRKNNIIMLFIRCFEKSILEVNWLRIRDDRIFFEKRGVLVTFLEQFCSNLVQAINILSRQHHRGHAEK